MKRSDAVALLSGVLFAIGLGLSGMTQPPKVLGFLDVFGAWDAALMFVMMGAIAVHAIPALWARRQHARPVLCDAFDLPQKTAIDARLIGGAALFGLGWGASGYCPGPAIVSLVTLSPITLAFVASMLAGMFVHTLVIERPRARAAQAERERDLPSRA